LFLTSKKLNFNEKSSKKYSISEGGDGGRARCEAKKIAVLSPDTTATTAKPV